MKTKISGILLAVILFTGTQISQAQIKFGVKAGLNLANMNGKRNGKDVENNKTTLLSHIGLVTDIALTDNLSFQPGLLLSTKGSQIGEIKIDNNKQTSKLVFDWIEIPLNVNYGVDLGSAKLNLFAGPYLAFAPRYRTIEKSKYDSDGVAITQSVTTATFKTGNEDKHQYRGFDYGATIGAGVEFSGIFVNAQYGLGLANIVTKGNSDNSAYNRVIGLSVGYYFGDN